MNMITNLYLLRVHVFGGSDGKQRDMPELDTDTFRYYVLASTKSFGGVATDSLMPMSDQNRSNTLNGCRYTIQDALRYSH